MILFINACVRSGSRTKRLADRLLSKLNGRVEINNIGNLIGSHTGPGTVALFFWGDERID